MIDHLSYSSIRRYLECSKSWEFKYLQGLDDGGSAAMNFGKAWHEFLRLIGTGSGDHFRERWQYCVERFAVEPGDASMGEDWTIYKTYKNYLERIPLWASPGADDWERKVLFDVPGVPVPVIGYIDHIARDGTIVDFKTSKRKWAQGAADESLQATAYAAAMGVGKTREFATIEFHVFTKTKTPGLQILETTRDVSDVMQFYNIAKQVWDAIEMGIFVPNPIGWHCSESYCPFWQHCMGGKIIS
jgi:hypothetical protein